MVRFPTIFIVNVRVATIYAKSCLHRLAKVNLAKEAMETSQENGKNNRVQLKMKEIQGG